MDRQVHRHLTYCIPSCTLNSVFNLALIEVVVPMLLRHRPKLVIPGDIETLMSSNLLVENQKKLED